MSIADLCLLLGVLFAFATLVVKIIEVARKDYVPGGARSDSRAPNAIEPRSLTQPELTEGQCPSPRA